MGLVGRRMVRCGQRFGIPQRKFGASGCGSVTYIRLSVAPCTHGPQSNHSNCNNGYRVFYICSGFRLTKWDKPSACTSERCEGYSVLTE